MPLREFGGRAAGGALGLQHGTGVVGALGIVTVVFPVAFGAVPDVVAVALDAANDYKVTLRAVTALQFTAHVVATHNHVAFTTGDYTTGAPNDLVWVTSGAGAAHGRWGVDNGSGAANKTCTTANNVDAAAPAGVTVMWFAMT